MQVQIPAAHGKAIEERRRTIDTMLAQLLLMKGEDKRHVNAVIRTAGLEPADYGEYTLLLNGEDYFLDLSLKQEPAPPASQSAIIAEDSVSTSADRANGLARE